MSRATQLVRLNPYQHLLAQIKEFMRKDSNGWTPLMWRYPKGKLVETWRLDHLYERTAAASQLGYEVILVATDDHLEVRYRKKRQDVPWGWR